MVQKYLQRDKWWKKYCVIIPIWHCVCTVMSHGYKRGRVYNAMIWHCLGHFDDCVQCCRCLYHPGFQNKSAESIGWTWFLICRSRLKVLKYNNYLETSDIQFFWPKAAMWLGEDVGMLTASFNTPLKKLQLLYVSIMKAAIECDSISVPCHCFFNASLVQTCFLWSCSWCKMHTRIPSKAVFPLRIWIGALLYYRSSSTMTLLFYNSSANTSTLKPS